jgi:ABC-type Mn2+/Zn2+ transport systems, permease components
MENFFDLLTIYKWSLPSSVIMAMALAFIGSQWTAREKSAQIFVLGQGSSLGVVLGLIINIVAGTDFHWLNLVAGFALGAITLGLSDALIERKPGRNHIYLSLFVFFLALTYLLSALTPSLETHLASAYFGDLAVMSDFGAQVCLITALAFVIIAIKYGRKLSLLSFQIVNQSLIHRTWKLKVFDLATLLLTTMAVQNMGYLFTMGCLFIATSFASQQSKSLNSYTVRLALVASLGSLIGFSVSLLSTRFPTVPCVLIGQIAVGIALSLYRKK